MKLYKLIRVYIIFIQLCKKKFATTFKIKSHFFKISKICLIILQKLECYRLKFFLVFFK